MFIHIPESIFARRPLLGILLGLVALTMSVFFMVELAIQHRGMASTPLEVDLKTIVPPADMRGPWVVVHQPLRIRCEKMEEIYDPMERLLFGRVKSTYFLAEIVDSDRWLVLEQGGEASCRTISGTPPVGVLEKSSRFVVDFVRERQLLPPVNAVVMTLSLSENPAQVRRFFFYMSLIGAGGVFCVIHYWRIHQRTLMIRKPLRAIV